MGIAKLALHSDNMQEFWIDDRRGDLGSRRVGCGPFSAAVVPLLIFLGRRYNEGLALATNLPFFSIKN